MDVQTSGSETLGIIMGVAGMIIGLAVLVLVIVSIISILMHRDLTGGGKLLWILGVLWLPILGSVAWFVIGKKGNLNHFLGIDRQGHGPTPATG